MYRSDVAAWILDDTLLGFRLPPWRKARKRRLIETEEYFLFEVGIVRALSAMRLVQLGPEEFGCAVEHFLLQEIRRYPLTVIVLVGE